MRDIHPSNVFTPKASRASGRNTINGGRREPAPRSVAIPFPVDRIRATSPESILARMLELTRYAFQIRRKSRTK